MKRRKKTYIAQLGPVGHLVRKILSKAYIVQYILSGENQGTDIQKIYSSLHLVVERMEELMEGTSLEESGWFQRERSFKLPVLCRGMVGFGQRRIFGTVGKEHPSPPLPSPAVGEVLKPLELQLDGLNCF